MYLSKLETHKIYDVMMWEVEHIVNSSINIWAGQKSKDKPNKSLEE